MKLKIIFLLLFIAFFCQFGAHGNNNPYLEERIRKILERIPEGTRYGVLALEPLTNDTVFAQNITTRLTPASVAKLYTTTTALNLLGPDFLIATKLLFDDMNISDGVINGNLYIKGYGNPLFTGDSLRKLVTLLREAGVHKITGKILGDDSYFDQEYFRRDWIEDEPGGDIIPPISALIIDRNMTTVKKKIRRKRYKYVTEIVRQPALNAALRLRAELIAQGVAIGGEAGTGTSPKNAKPMAVSGITLRNLIKVINKRSDNFLAECLFKILGAEYSKKPGTGFSASQAVNFFLEGHDIVTDRADVVDGSGLSHNNLVSVRSVVSLLEWAYLNLPAYDDFHQSLSHAGYDGTLRGRMDNLPAGSAFRGKTGTLRGHIALAGYLRCTAGDEIIICIIFDFDRQSPYFYKAIEDEIVSVLAEYKR